MDFTPETCLICDDVRREITNKDILIGVYAAEINTPALPAQINLSFWLLITPKKLGPLSLELKIDLPGAPQPAQIKIDTMVIEPIRPFSLFTPQASYRLLKEGDLKVSVRQFGKEQWRLIARAKVVYVAPSFGLTPTS